MIRSTDLLRGLNMNITDIKRGGARPGAGRKCLAPEARRVTISISVSQGTMKMVRELRGSGYNISAMLEDAIMDQHRLIFAD